MLHLELAVLMLMFLNTVMLGVVAHYFMRVVKTNDF